MLYRKDTGEEISILLTIFAAIFGMPAMVLSVICMLPLLLITFLGAELWLLYHIILWPFVKGELDVDIKKETKKK